VQGGKRPLAGAGLIECGMDVHERGAKEGGSQKKDMGAQLSMVSHDGDRKERSPGLGG